MDLFSYDPLQRSSAQIRIRRAIDSGHATGLAPLTVPYPLNRQAQPKDNGEGLTALILALLGKRRNAAVRVLKKTRREAKRWPRFHPK
jgi:hypothetical protein